MQTLSLSAMTAQDHSWMCWKLWYEDAPAWLGKQDKQAAKKVHIKWDVNRLVNKGQIIDESQEYKWKIIYVTLAVIPLITSWADNSSWNPFLQAIPRVNNQDPLCLPFQVTWSL